MNTALWIVQALLGISFTLAGLRKITENNSKLGPQLPWTTRFPIWLIKLIGVLELLAGLGFILPRLAGVQQELTPLTAASVAVAMIFAFIHHLRYREKKEAVMNVVILLLSAFIIYGRYESQYVTLS